MVNLLPTAAKRQIVVEYYLRTVTVWLFLLTGAATVLGMLLIPVAVLVNLQLDAYAETYTRVSADNASFAEAEEDVRQANDLASLLSGVSAYAPVWPDIAFVMDMAGPAITVTEVNAVREKEVVAAVTVSGDAATRAALAAYRDALEADPRVLSAALPLSNLAKDRDVPFSIVVTFNREQE